MDISTQIQQGIEKTSQSNRFNVANIPRHVHNNIDTPYAFQPILTYGGSITSTGASNFLPSSWTASLSGTEYTITHNLNTSVYVAHATAQGTQLGVTAIQGLNTVIFVFFTVGTGGGVDTTTNFTFTLTVFNNSKPNIPIYTGSFINKTQSAPPF